MLAEELFKEKKDWDKKVESYLKRKNRSSETTGKAAE